MAECISVFRSRFGGCDDLSLSPTGAHAAAAVSMFEGNTWGGVVSILCGTSITNADEAAADPILREVCHLKWNSGCSSVRWLSEKTLAFGTDAGDVCVASLSSPPPAAEEGLAATDLAATASPDALANVDEETGAAPPLPPMPVLPPSLQASTIAMTDHEDAVTSLANSRHELRRLVSGSSDCTVRVWDAEHGKALASFAGHTDAVEAVDCSQQTPHLAASASRDGSVRVWDLRSAQDSSRTSHGLDCRVRMQCS